MTERLIDWRLNTGEWKVLFPGVYTVRSSSPSWMRSEMGAVLWAGSGAAGSGRAAGLIWDFDGIDRRYIEVSTSRRVRHPDVVVHRTGNVGRTLMRKGILVTDPFRTIVDLAALIEKPNLEAALDSGLRSGSLNLPFLEKTLNDAGPRRGLAHLKALVRERRDCIGLTRSALEALVSDFLRECKIPTGYRNYDLVIDGRFIACLDVAWPELRIGIEVDSRRWHMGHEAWESDSSRYANLVSLDWRIFPVTSHQLRHKKPELAGQLQRLLGQRGFDLT